MELANPQSMTREEIIARIQKHSAKRNVEVRDESGKCTGIEKVPCTMGEAIKAQFSN